MSQKSHPWNIQDQLAVQLYTVRDYVTTKANFAETLRKLSETGYRAVQLSAVGAMSGPEPEVSPALARQMLDDNGLKAIATHRSWEALAEKTEEEVEFHQILGCDYTAIGGIPGSYGKDGIAGYRRWVVDATELAAKLKTAGIRFGFHNHAHEFEKFGDDRTTLYSTIVDGGPDIYLELDVYWVNHAGINPTKLIDALHGRLPVVHVKDVEVFRGKPVMAPIGEGNLDWDEIIPALKSAGTEWYAVEQDECQRDPFDCLKSSFEFLSR